MSVVKRRRCLLGPADGAPEPGPWRGGRGDVSAFIPRRILRRGGPLCWVLVSVSPEGDGVLPDSAYLPLSPSCTGSVCRCSLRTPEHWRVRRITLRSVRFLAAFLLSRAKRVNLLPRRTLDERLAPPAPQRHVRPAAALHDAGVARPLNQPAPGRHRRPHGGDSRVELELLPAGGGGFRRPVPEGFGALCQGLQLPGGPRREREGLRICQLECDRTRGSIGVEANSAPRPRQ